MAARYVDHNGAGDNTTATTWATSYDALATGMDGADFDSGDDVYIMGQLSTTGSVTLQAGQTTGHPIRLLGCKSTTTAEPPVTADLIPGWRTGETRTEANLAYNDSDIPSYTLTAVGDDIGFNGTLYAYAVKFDAEDDIQYVNSSVADELIFEECHLKCDKLTLGSTGQHAIKWRFINCHIEWNLASQGFTTTDIGEVEMRGGKVTGASGAHPTGMISAGVESMHFSGVDFSDAAHTLVNINLNMGNGPIRFWNCQLHASTAVLGGTRSSSPFRIELYGCEKGLTGKTSGTVTELDIHTNAGDVVIETTAIRTGGATDGTTPYSIAMTPVVDGTRDQYYPLVGPWMHLYVDSTTTTITVPIANSGAGDYNDDDVYLEIESMSDIGNSAHSNDTTQMNLLATPSAVTDDAVSTWGTGASNGQSLVGSIDPDYDGVIRCRVCFTKNFGASPETLYHDWAIAS